MIRINTLIKSLFLSLALCASAFAADRVDVNHADATAIAETLSGVGMTKAQAIIEWREANGDFQSADQLAEVKGIGLKTVEKNRDRILLSTPTE